MKVVKRIPSDAVLSCARWTAIEPMMLPDNVIANCFECGHAIQHRPHAPKKIRKVCMHCMEIDKDTKIITTPRMIEDFQRYLRSKKQ